MESARIARTRAQLLVVAGVSALRADALRREIEHVLVTVSRIVRMAGDRIPSWVTPGFAELCGVYMAEREDAKGEIAAEMDAKRK